MKNNRNIIFTKADKGNITVALNKVKYISEIMTMLNETETYITIIKNPINTLTRRTRELLVHWKKKEFITEQTYKKLLCTDGIRRLLEKFLRTI